MTRMTCIKIVGLALVATSLVPAQTSPTNLRYNLANQHTYAVTPYYVDWQAAQAYSRTLGGHLVAINGGAEQSFVAGYGGPGFDALWIGLSDAGVEGTYVWDSGEPVLYTNWCAGEPNNSGGAEDHVEIFSYHTGGLACWNDNSSPYSGPGIPAARGLIELAHGVRVNFDAGSTTCATSPFPTPLGATSHQDGISWNGAGAALSRFPAITNVVEDGMPVNGAQYFRMVGHGAISMPIGGPLARPLAAGINEVRVAIPPLTKGISFAWEFLTSEDLAPYNDGIDISVVDASGNPVASLVYADSLGSLLGAASTGGLVSGAYCGTLGGYHAIPSGPQTESTYVPVLPYPAYLSIVCWNGTDNALSSAVHVDAIQFWGTGKFQLDITAPFGPGSIRLQNSQGTPSAGYITAVTLAQGSFPNGWLFGLDIALNDLFGQIGTGVPFTGTLDLAGASTWTLPNQVPPGLPIYAVSIDVGSAITASAPVFFVTL
jgi:hypothetical protein